MAVWVRINSEADLPKHGNKVVIKYHTNEVDYRRVLIEDPALCKWWVRNVFSWLDDTTPSFTLDDMRNCYNKGYDDGFCNETQPYFEDYMLTTHNIKL